MLTKNEEASDSWTESKKEREDPLAAIGLLKIAAPQVLMTYYVGVPTDALSCRRYTCTYGRTTRESA